MYKSEQRYGNENLLTRNARAGTHMAFQPMVILKREVAGEMMCTYWFTA